MEVIIHFSHLDFSTAPHQLSAVCHFVSMFGCGTFIHPQHASTRTSINYLNLLCGGKIWFPLRAMSDDVDEIKFDKCRDARTLLRLTRIVCYPDLRASSVKDVCIFILSRAVVLTMRLFSESFHHWGREAVQSFPTQPFSRTPSVPGSPAVPGWGLDPVQGEGAWRATETQGPLQ